MIYQLEFQKEQAYHFRIKMVILFLVDGQYEAEQANSVD